MTRYQIYLNPGDIKIIDEVSTQLAVSRSHIIRDLVSRASREFAKILKAAKKIPLKDHPLIKLIGAEKSRTGDVASNIDEIYLQD